MNWQTIHQRGYIKRHEQQALEMPVGDPLSGPAYGQFNDIGSAALSIGGNIVGGLIGADGAENAAETQAGAAREANALTQRQFNQMRGDLTPYRQSGEIANNRLSYLLGLTKDPYLTSGSNPGDSQWQNIWNDLVINQKYGFSTPDEVNALTKATTERYKAENPEAWKNYTDAQLGDLEYNSLNKNFTGADLQNEPGYQFGLTEGQKGLDRRQLAGGNYLSGAALKAASRYNQDYASTKFDNAFNRDAANKNRLYSMLSGVSGQGQNAAAMTGTAGLNAAGTMGNNLIGAGNAQAAGQVGAANAISNGIGGAINAYQWNQLLGQNKKSTPDWTTAGYGWDGGYSDY